MRKNIITNGPHSHTSSDRDWLDLEAVARAELTSEDPGHLLEAALKPGVWSGWRASESGRQTIRLHFDQPQVIRHVHLAFREEEEGRTQEFTVRWSADDGRTYQEIVRQQYTFSPPDTAFELEEYEVDLAGVTTLEITIVPDISSGPARASLAELRLA